MDEQPVAAEQIYRVVEMMAVRQKQARTRKAGYRGSMNTQDFAPTIMTPALRRQRLRELATNFLGLMGPWCEGRQAETIARAAVRALVDTLDKEKS